MSYINEYKGIALTPGQVKLLARIDTAPAIRQAMRDSLNEQDMEHAKYIELRYIDKTPYWRITLEGFIALRAYQEAVNRDSEHFNNSNDIGQEQGQ